MAYYHVDEQRVAEIVDGAIDGLYYEFEECFGEGRAEQMQDMFKAVLGNIAESICYAIQDGKI